MQSIDQINQIERRRDTSDEGLNDLLWSEPDEYNLGWRYFHGMSGFYGSDMVEKFLRENNINLICRGHSLVMSGYQSIFNDTLVKICSAPNYCFRCGNSAAILEFDENMETNFKTFE